MRKLLGVVAAAAMVVAPGKAEGLMDFEYEAARVAAEVKRELSGAARSAFLDSVCLGAEDSEECRDEMVGAICEDVGEDAARTAWFAWRGADDAVAKVAESRGRAKAVRGCEDDLSR